MSLKDTLGVVISKVAQNKVNVNNALAQAQASLTQADDETIAAAKVLISKFSNPQGAAQILQNVYQVEALADTATEMDAMIAGLEVLLTDEKALSEADAVFAANAQASLSPLSAATGQTGADPVADPGQSSEAASPAA